MDISFILSKIVRSDFFPSFKYSYISFLRTKYQNLKKKLIKIKILSYPFCTTFKYRLKKIHHFFQCAYQKEAILFNEAYLN